jgi:hypothetical protein
MSKSAPVAATGPRGRASTTSLLLAVAGAGATVLVWIILAAITGLIYHFLPGAPFLVAAWVFRQVEGGRPAEWREIAALAAAGAAASVLGILTVASIGRDLDAPVATALVALAGAALGVVWLRRRSTHAATDRHPDAST